VSLMRTRLLAGTAIAALTAGVVLQGGPIRSAQAQNLGQRVVMGSVVDGGGAPIIGATVFLKDLKSKSIRSFTTVDKGRFNFVQVNMAEDHELWAEKDKKKSAVKTVSSWDTRKEFECELKLK
jgi:hypothetical protein